VRSYVTKPTTIRAITEIPANTPRPMGKTESFLPGMAKAAVDADSLAAAAVPEAAPVEVADTMVTEIPPTAAAGVPPEAAAEAVDDALFALATAEPETVETGPSTEAAGFPEPVPPVAVDVAEELDVVLLPVDAAATEVATALPETVVAPITDTAGTAEADELPEELLLSALVEVVLALVEVDLLLLALVEVVLALVEVDMMLSEEVEVVLDSDEEVDVDLDTEDVEVELEDSEDELNPDEELDESNVSVQFRTSSTAASPLANLIGVSVITQVSVIGPASVSVVVSVFTLVESPDGVESARATKAPDKPIAGAA